MSGHVTKNRKYFDYFGDIFENNLSHQKFSVKCPSPVGTSRLGTESLSAIMIRFCLCLDRMKDFSEYSS